MCLLEKIEKIFLKNQSFSHCPEIKLSIWLVSSFYNSIMSVHLFNMVKEGQAPLDFHYSFRISFSIAVRKFAKILIGIMLNL